MSKLSRRSRRRRKLADRTRRPLQTEQLEHRLLLAGEVIAPMHYVFNPPDVDMDGKIAPKDGLIVLNQINQYGSGPIEGRMPGESPFRYDTDGNNILSPADFARVVNAINDGGEGSAHEQVGFRLEARDIELGQLAILMIDVPGVGTISVPEITMDSPDHGLTVGTLVDISWNAGKRTRFGVPVSTVDGDKVRLNAATGSGAAFEDNVAVKVTAPLTGNRAEVGQDIELAAYVQDLRDAPTGVFAGFIDVGFTGDINSFSLVYSEVQRLTLSNKTTSGNLGLSLGSDTVMVPITGTSAQLEASLQAAIESLPEVGVGNVRVVNNMFVDDNDAANNNNLRWDITFINDLFEMDIPALQADASGLSVSEGNPTATVDEIAKGERANAEAFRRAFTTGPDYPNGQTAEDGDVNPATRELLDANVYSEVGSFDGNGFPAGTLGNERLLWTVRLNADAVGSFTFQASGADEPTESDVLVFRTEDPVPHNVINFGDSLTVSIVEDVVAIDDTYTGSDAVAEDSSNNPLPVLDNDTALEGTLQITGVSNFSAGGAATIISNGTQLSYSPAGNFFGTETFMYTVTNGLGASSEAMVTVEVTEVNDAPTAGDDTKSVDEDMTLNFDLADLLANDVVGPSTPGTNETATQMFQMFSFGTGSQSGTINIDDKGTPTDLSDDTVSYTPPMEFSGDEIFTYTVTDNGTTNGSSAPLSDTATLTITVNEINDPPVAGDDSRSATEDTDLVFSADTLLGNDTPGPQNEIDAGQTVSVTGVSSTSTEGGTVSLSGGTITYTPPGDYFGSDTFTYTITDTGIPNATDTATITIDVAPVNDPPVAVNDINIDVDELSEFADNPIDVLANDNPGGGVLEAAVDTLTITIVSDPANGMAQIDGDIIRYEPDPTFVDGTDTFTYTIEDGGELTDTATVSINVVPAVRPRARNDSVAFDEGGSQEIDVLANDLANVGAMPTLLSWTDPTHGTLSLNDQGTPQTTDDTLTYTPNDVNFFGSDSFTYTINDTLPANDANKGVDSTATVTIDVAPINDAPVLSVPSATQNVDEDMSLSISGIVVSDVDQDFATAPFTLDVTLSVSDGAITLGTTSGLTFDSGANGQSSMSISGTIANINGALDSLSYQGDSHFNGGDTLSLSVSDQGNVGGGALSDSDTISITINPINDAPVLSVPGSQQGIRNTDLVFSSGGSNAISIEDVDSAGDDLAVTLSVSNGTLMLSTTSGLTTATNDGDGNIAVSGPVNSVNDALDGLTYTPDNDYTGPDSLSVSVNDNGNNGAGGAMSDSASVSIEVLNFVPVDFSGVVFFDVDGNGSRDSSENTISKIDVMLTGIDMFGNHISLSTTTDKDGAYSFMQLAPGDYTAKSMGVDFTLDGREQVGNQGGTADHSANTISSTIPFTTDPIDGSNNNFGVLGVRPEFITLAERLGSSSGSGIVIATNAHGDQLWHSLLDGWSGATDVSAVLSSDMSTFDLTVTTSSGSTTRTMPISGRYTRLMGTDGDGGYVIRVDGVPSAMGFPMAANDGDQGNGEGEGESSDVESAEAAAQELYAQAVDELMAQA